MRNVEEWERIADAAEARRKRDPSPATSPVLAACRGVFATNGPCPLGHSHKAVNGMCPIDLYRCLIIRIIRNAGSDAAMRVMKAFPDLDALKGGFDADRTSVHLRRLVSSKRIHEG